MGHTLYQILWVTSRPYWKLYFPMAITVMVIVSFETCFPLAIRFLIDDALIPRKFENLISVLSFLVAISLAVIIARYVMALIRAYMNAELNKDMRVMLVQYIERLPMSYFDKIQPAHFAPIFDTELVTYSRMVRDLFSRGFYYCLQCAVIITTMLILNWQLALIILVVVPVMLVPTYRHLAPTLDALDRIRKTIERVNSAIQDHVSTQALVRAFGLGERESKRFVGEVVGRKGARDAFWSYSDIKRTSGIPHFLMQSFELSVQKEQTKITLFVVIAGACLAFFGNLTIGTFSAFILFLPVIMSAVSNLAEFLRDLGRAKLSLHRLDSVKNARQPAPTYDGIREIRVPSKAIRFSDVAFSYAADTPYMSGVSLEIPIGQSVAFVGRSGAGKSTLFRLLLGFYRPTSGHIYIDDVDINQVSPASLGCQIGTVLQQSVLTNTTIAKNISFAKPDATEEEIARAATRAGIHSHIISLPNGYDTAVGEGGKWLSEGQRQRIALARAILPNPPILLLDEVTASLDPEAETAINATIQELAKERTVILVTHRLASIAFVDHVVVVDQGRVKEQGRPDDLLARQGLYAQLWQLQSGFVVSSDGHRAEVSGKRLQAIPLFRDVDIATLDLLAEKFVSEFYQADQVIYQEGKSGEKFYIVVRGTVVASTMDAGQQSIRLADLQDGDYVGEVEMLNRGRRTTTVASRTPTLLLALHVDHFHAMLDELSSVNKIVTQMALGRSLTTICSVGRRRRSNPVWQELVA